ncbi:MAG: dockerin type I domain-containing protein [Planctomycetes bacterium]|nr:dockerin type I domain-containing protein [Planctomycetota bacterium]
MCMFFPNRYAHRALRKDRGRASWRLAQSLAFGLVVALMVVAPAAAEANDNAGDCNLDNRIDLTDVLTILEFLFVSEKTSACYPFCDTNTDGRVDLSDALTLISFLFHGGRTPGPAVLTSELCDGIDTNCDGKIDEGCPSSGGIDVTLGWAPVRFDVEGNVEEVAGYRLFFGTASKDYAWARNVGKNLQYRVRGLIPGIRYVFAVSCLDRAGNESETSSEIFFVPR